MTEFYELSVNGLVNVYGGPLYSTEYSLAAACDLCGTGAEPVGPRIIRRFHVSKAPVFMTLAREILVNLDIAQGLRALGVESLADVHGVKTGEELPLKELRAEATLPPFSEETTGYVRERACTKCGRDGYFGTTREPLRLVYRDLPREYAKKRILATYERFGNSRLRVPFKDSGFASLTYVVNAPVADYLKEKCKKRVVLEPVDITWAR